MASGDRASTSRKPRKKGAKGGRSASQKEQSERFKEAARALDADESGEEFDRAFKKIIPPKNNRPSGNK